MGATERVEQTDRWNDWRRSSRCTAGVCVELCPRPDGTVGLRDSKLAHLGDEQPVLVMTAAAFELFKQEICGDAPLGINGEIAINRQGPDDIVVRSLLTGAEAHFVQHEIEALQQGIKLGEFDLALAS